MKIVIIANNSNGLYLFRRQLISALIEKGHKIIALTPFDANIENLRRLGIKLVETPIDRRGTNPLRDYSLLKLYRVLLRKTKPDLVITYTIKPNIYGGMVCRKLKIPYAANITGLGTVFETSGILRFVATMMNRIALKKARIVFFENSYNRNRFVQSGIIKKEKTFVLPGAGVDLTHFYYQEYPENKVFKFLFIGRVMKEKGINEILAAMRSLINGGFKCSLDILGAFEEDYKKIFDKAIAEGWLNYHGNQPDVRPYIGECDCFVLPSYHEGMANTILESASTGRPVITSNIPGCREAVVKGSGILCIPKNVDSLYGAMKKIMTITYSKRVTMGKIGRKHMEDTFDKNKVVDETILQLMRSL